MFFIHKAALGLASLALLGLAAAGPVSAQTYDAAGDFSATSNPTGAWSYGYENTLGSTFHLYTDKFAPTANTAGWYLNLASNVPLVVKNFGSADDSFADLVLHPGQLAFHPGPNDEYSIVRFTAAQAGVYSLNTSFTPVTTDGTTTDVHVLDNGASLFDGLVAGTGAAPVSAPSFASSLTLAAGDTVDFAVGFGPNGNYYQDSTGLSATLTAQPVPEASTTISLGLLLTLGLGGVVLTARKKKAVNA